MHQQDLEVWHIHTCRIYLICSVEQGRACVSTLIHPAYVHKHEARLSSTLNRRGNTFVEWGFRGMLHSMPNHLMCSIDVNIKQENDVNKPSRAHCLRMWNNSERQENVFFSAYHQPFPVGSVSSPCHVVVTLPLTVDQGMVT